MCILTVDIFGCATTRRPKPLRLEKRHRNGLELKVDEPTTTKHEAPA